MKRSLFITIGILIWNISFSQLTELLHNANTFGGLQVNGHVIFAGGTGQVGTSDGTPAGTSFIPASTVVIDFSDTFSNSLWKNRFFFSGYNAATGTELWATDGTAAGTVMVKDINPGPASSKPHGRINGGENFCIVNGLLYFIANDGVNGYQLWKTDGTTSGTALVKVINALADPQIEFPRTKDTNFYAGNYFYFAANDGINGKELWKTDGTAANTQIVANITPGSGSTSFGESFYGICNTLLFFADDGTSGAEPWRTDGTAIGTYRLAQIAPGALGSIDISPNRNINAITFRNRLFFVGNSAGPNNNNPQIWVSDGTIPGTYAISNWRPNSGGLNAQFDNASAVMTKLGGVPQLYFPVTFDGNNVTAIWRLNSGFLPQRITPIYPGNSAPPGNYQLQFYLPQRGNDDGFKQHLFQGNKFFFMGTDGVHGHQLWITDGLPNNTQMLTINPTGDGIDTSNNGDNFQYKLTEDQMIFTGVTAANGSELWRSDGTQSGTVLIKDINPGPGSSNIQMFGLTSDTAFVFAAFDGTTTNIYKWNTAVVAVESAEEPVVCSGGTSVFTSNLSGATYQWQVDNGSGFSDISNNGTYSGATTQELTVTAMPASFRGYTYRCKVNGSIYSRIFKIVFTNYWTGAVSTAWENPLNWSCGLIPDAATDVVIQCGAPNYPEVNFNTSCRSVIVASGQSIKVKAGVTLTVVSQ